MPEAPVHEHRYATACEDEVWSDTSVRQVEAIVLAEAQTSPMQQRSQGDFGLRVASPDGCQVARAPRALGRRLGVAGCGVSAARGHSRNVGRWWWGRPVWWGRMGRMACALPVPAGVDVGEQR
jgi:hypothetical protein